MFAVIGYRLDAFANHSEQMNQKQTIFQNNNQKIAHI